MDTIDTIRESVLHLKVTASTVAIRKQLLRLLDTLDADLDHVHYEPSSVVDEATTKLKEEISSLISADDEKDAPTVDLATPEKERGTALDFEEDDEEPKVREEGSSVDEDEDKKE